MAVSKSAFKIIKRAVEIRISRGEEIHEVVDSYPRLSNEQKQQIIDELAPKEEKSTEVKQPITTERPAQSEGSTPKAEESTQAESKTSTEESTPKTAEQKRG